MLFIAMSIPVAQAEEQPDHDIVVFDLSVVNEQLTIKNPQIIAASPNYDNQPFFSKDGQTVYFTHMEGANTDIWKWSVRDNKIEQITDTDISEYSPTEIPFEIQSLSTVREDGLQRLWKYSAENGFTVLFETIKPVGYHVWSGKNIAMFILGTPHTLQTTVLGQENTKIIDANIGRCLQKLPGQNVISYTVEKEQTMQLKLFNFDNNQMTVIKDLPANVQDYAWYSQDKIVTSDGQKLVFSSLKADSSWQEINNSSQFEMNSISRIAISPQQDKLAVVYVKAIKDVKP